MRELNGFELTTGIDKTLNGNGGGFRRFMMRVQFQNLGPRCNGDTSIFAAPVHVRLRRDINNNNAFDTFNLFEIFDC